MAGTCVAIVGLPGAGKTTLLRVAQRVGCCTVEWSSAIPQPKPPANRPLSKFDYAQNLSHRMGPDFMASLVFDALHQREGDLHAVSGARNSEELSSLLTRYRSWRVLWVHADLDERLTRLKMRSRIGDPEEVACLLKRDLEELAGGLAQIGYSKMTDLICNDRRIDEFEEEAELYFRRLLSEGG